MAARGPVDARVDAMAEPGKIALGSAVINGTRLNWVKEHYEGFWGKVERCTE